MNRKPLIAIGLVILVSVGLVLFWKMQGLGMRGEFVRALQEADIHGPHRDLLGKIWTDDERATAEVLKVPDGTDFHQSIERSVHAMGRIEVSRQQYGYQGTVRDASTGIVHVFGRTRSKPHRWCWVQTSRASTPQVLERRLEQLEEMKQRAK